MQFAVFDAFYTKWKDNEFMLRKSSVLFNVEYRVLFAGMMSGAIRSFVETPFEFVKVRRQTKQSWDIKSFYTGLHLNLVRNTMLLSIYFVLVDWFWAETTAYEYKAGQFLINGGSALLAYWVIWPLEVLKNQVQAGTTDGGATLKSKSKYIFSHGLRGIYRGIFAGTISIFCRNGAGMVSMQYAH